MNLSSFLSVVKAYPQGVIEEFRKIDWPEWEQTRQRTGVVTVIVVIATLFVGAIDVIFTRMAQLFLG